MDSQQIKELISRYYQAETSPDEESHLKEWLSTYSGDDSELLEAKTLFDFYTGETLEEVDLNFDEITGNKKTIKLRPVLTWASSIAAALIIAFGLMFLIKTPKQPVVYAYIDGKPITDKKVAMQDTQKALMLMSNSLNKGTEGLAQLDKLNEPIRLLTK